MMVRRIAILSTIGLAASLMMWGCSEDNPTGSTPTTTNGILVESVSYTTYNNLLITSWPDTLERSSYCSGSELVERYDTTEAGSDTTEYELAGNTLKVVVDTSTLDSGAVVVWRWVYTRSGSGTGLSGTWNITSVEYSVVSGTPTAQESLDLAAEAAEIQADIVEGEMEISVVITASTMSVYINYSYADMFIDGFESEIDTSMFDVTMVKVNNNTVRVTGNITGETVLITYSPSNETTTWTSSIAAHATHVYYDNPISCPNTFEPSWFMAFAVANLKTFAKTVTFELTPPVKPSVQLFAR